MDSHHITHGESLWERLDVLRDKGSHGAKTCLAMGTFLRESAAVENTYGKALVKAAERRVVKPQNSAPGVGWAPSLMQQGWAGVVAAVNSWGKQHVGWALCVDQNISKSLTQFAARHERHVEDLWTEAQDLVSDLEVVQGEYYRAKDAYERACIDATRLLDERNKARENAAAATEHDSGGSARSVPLSADTPNKAVGIATSPSKEGQGGSMLSSMSKMFEKVSEGMAMAVAIAAGDLTLDELEEKVPGLLQKVDVTESEYIASIMAVNGYTTEFQPELEAKLKQFQLLEESRIMHIREALLRLDQATRGMLDCLLGPGGTLEAMSAALSRVDIVGDLRGHIVLVREQAGLPSIPCAKRVTCKESMAEKRDTSDEAGKHESPATLAPGSGAESASDSSWQMVGVHESQRATGIAILDLGEEELTKAFEGTREVASECARCVQEMISCLEEVVAVQENHARDLLRLLARQGYGDRVSESEVTGSRGSTRVVADFHAIGATMEDVGKNVVANMSGTASSSSICAKAVAGEGKTLMEGWESSAVAKAVVSLEAHSRLAHMLANDFGSVAGKVHEEAKMSVARASKSFAASAKQVGAAKAVHSKTVSRYEKVSRELREKQDLLAKARVDLKAEIQASTGFPSEHAPSTSQVWGATAVVSPDASTTSTGDTSSTPLSPIPNPGTRPRSTNQQIADFSAESDNPIDGLGSDVNFGDVSGMRRDSPSVLETLGLSQGAWNRMRALELRLNHLNHEGSTAKQAVEDAVQGIEAALSGLGQTTKDICLAVLAEEESRHQHVTQMLDGVLAALLNTAKVFNEEQRRADESETTRNIDGQRDIEELVTRNARSPQLPGVGSRARCLGQNDGVGEVMFMAYHSEVLQRERDLRRRTHLSSASAASGAWSPVENVGMRQAGGGGHLFTAMAEAALAQAHAKRQQRQAYLKGQQQRQFSEGDQLTGSSKSPRTSVSRFRRPIFLKTSEDSSRLCLSDGEIPLSNRQRNRRRHRHALRRGAQSLEHMSDSELMGFGDTLSRHGGGGSFHGVRRWGSRQSSRHGSTQSSRQSSFRVSRHDTVRPIMACGGSQTSGEFSQDLDQNVPQVSQTHPAYVKDSEQSSRVAPVTWQPVREFDAEPGLVETSVLAYPKHGDDVGVNVDVEVDEPCSTSLREEGTGGDDQDDHRKHGGDGSREERMENARACESEAQEGIRSSESSVNPAMKSRPFVEEQNSSEREDQPAISTREEAPAAEKAGTSSVPHAHPQADPHPYDGLEHEDEREHEQEPIGDKMTPVDDQGADSDSGEQAKGVMRGGDVENERSGNEIYTPNTEYPTEELGFHGFGGPDVFPTEELGTEKPVEIAKLRRPTGTRRAEHGKGRPSLRSLRHRVTHQDDGFSSCGEVEELSSTDDDRLSERSVEVSPGVDKMRALDCSSPRQYPLGRTVEGHEADVPDKTTLSPGIEPSSGAKVIESYSCALYGGGLPLHGRLSITANSARFSGWRNTKIVLPLSDIAAVEKTSTLGIVPNALTFVRRSGIRVTLGSFLFRDDCHALLMRLVMVASSISMLENPLSTSESITGANTAVAGTRDAGDSPGDEVHLTAPAESLSEPSESDPGVAVHRRLAHLDDNGNGIGSLDVMVDETLPCTVAQAFTWLWGQHSDVWPGFMKDQGEVNLEISRWQMLTPGTEKSLATSGAPTVGWLGGLFPAENFEAQRELSFTHTRSGLVVGPKKILTRQAQAYRVERRRNLSNSEQRGTAAPMDRALVFQATRMERAPLAEYFTILGRVVMTRQNPLKASDGASEPRCRLQISFDVVFHKSTVLQRAIRSGASDESRTTWKAWLEAALKVVAYQQQVLGRAQSVAGVSAPPPSGVLTLASRPTPGEVAEKRSPTDQDVKGSANASIHDTSTLDKQDAGVWSVVVSVARSVRAVSFDAIASSRITLGLVFLCLLVIIIQQISIWRLARKVENLTVAVNDLRKQLG